MIFYLSVFLPLKKSNQVPPFSKGRLGGDCQSPRIARICTDYLSFTIKIRVNPRDTQERFPVYPPLPPPFQEGVQFACHAIQVPPRSKGRLGGDGQPPRISRISTDNLSFKIRYVKILVIRWRDSAANKKPLLSFGRICNPTVLSICIYNAKTMEFFEVFGLQIREFYTSDCKSD